MKKWSLFLFTTTLFFITIFLHTDTARAVTLFPDIVTQGESGEFKSGCGAYCSGNSTCVKGGTFSLLPITTAATEMCIPQITSSCKYPNGTIKKCGPDSACTLIASITNKKKFDLACLPEQAFNFVLFKTNGDGCQKNSECNIGSQCVSVIANLSGTVSSQATYTGHCMPLTDVPVSVVDGDGACNVNKKCSPSEQCVFNPITFSNGIPYTCVSNDVATMTDNLICTSLPEVKKLDDLKDNVVCGPGKLCMYAVKGFDGDPKFKDHYTCVDQSSVTGGTKSVSLSTCKENKDCPNASDPFCLYNATTKKNQCFSQSVILTDMSTIYSDTPKCMPGNSTCACTSAGTIGCGGNDKTICTSFFPTSLGAYDKNLVCINNTNTGSGSATVSLNVAQQTYEMYAPKLEVTIPGLSFDEKISATDGSKGIKVFSVSYLATYINAVYKYALGLGVLIAIVMIMYAGMRWMTSFGNAKAVGDARKMIGNAVLGLALLFGVYSILYVINPDLPKLTSLQILAPKQEVFWVAEVGNNEVNDGVPFTDNSGDGSQTVKKVAYLDHKNKSSTDASYAAEAIPDIFIPIRDLKQCGGTWGKKEPYFGKNKKPLLCTSSKNPDEHQDTICESGCAVTSLAVALSYQMHKDINPPETATYSAVVGGHLKCDGSIAETICNNISKKYPSLTCANIKGTDTDKITSYLRQNKPVVFSCHKCTGYTIDNNKKQYGAHFMVINGLIKNGTEYTILDVGNKSGIIRIPLKEFKGGHAANLFVIEKTSEKTAFIDQCHNLTPGA